jgi:uncharacterized membrane protein
MNIRLYLGFAALFVIVLTYAFILPPMISAGSWIVFFTGLVLLLTSPVVIYKFYIRFCGITK